MRTTPHTTAPFVLGSILVLAGSAACARQAAGTEAGGAGVGWSVLVVVVLLLSAGGGAAWWRRRRAERESALSLPPLVFPAAPAAPGPRDGRGGPPPRQAAPAPPAPPARPAPVFRSVPAGFPVFPPPPFAELEGSAAPAPAAPPADGTLQILPGRLEVVAGPESGRDIRFVRAGPTTEITLGRSSGPPYQHVQLRAPTVSRRHARMQYGPAGWTIANLSQTNPVVLNGVELGVEDEARPLRDGDRIEMGEVAFVFRER